MQRPVSLAACRFLCLAAVCGCAIATMSAGPQPAARTTETRLRGERFERAVAAMHRVLRAWIEEADAPTLLLPDRVPGIGSGLSPGDDSRIYTPHNSGADLYPYLVLTSEFTAPDLYRGRIMEMLRNEIRYTNTAWGIPGNPQSEDRRARRAEHVRCRRIRERRPAHDHRGEADQIVAVFGYVIGCAESKDLHYERLVSDARLHQHTHNPSSTGRLKSVCLPHGYL